jgi:hypothetical protein
VCLGSRSVLSNLERGWALLAEYLRRQSLGLDYRFDRFRGFRADPMGANDFSSGAAVPAR